MAWLWLLDIPRCACSSTSISPSWEVLSSLLILYAYPRLLQSSFPGCGEDTAPWPKVAMQRCGPMCWWPYASSSGHESPFGSLHNPCHRQMLETKPCLDGCSFPGVHQCPRSAGGMAWCSRRDTKDTDTVAQEKHSNTGLVPCRDLAHSSWPAVTSHSKQSCFPILLHNHPSPP